MATVMFVGDPLHDDGSDPERLQFMGLTFVLGEPRWVDDIEHGDAMAKIRGNSHFIVADQPLELIGDLWRAQLGYSTTPMIST